MANDLSAIMPKILARGLMTLRERCIMPRLVNSDYSPDAAKKGTTIDVEVPTAVETADVAPSNVPPSSTDTTQTTVQVSLDNWKQNKAIHLTDKELTQIDKNTQFLPMQLAEAMKSLANDVNQSIFATYKEATMGVYGYTGTAGTTPFASTVADATAARKLLNQQLCPKTDRRGVLDFDAEANALNLSPFSDAEKVGANGVKIEGEIGKKFGIIWASDDHVPTHTAGTLSNGTSAVANVNEASGLAIGAQIVDIDETTLTGTILRGDIISFAGHTQTYVVIDNSSSANFSSGVYTAASNAIADLKFYPPLKAAVANNEVMTLRASHVVNLAFHRDAFAFATRPLLQSDLDREIGGSKIMSMQDPLTGLNLRLEVSRQHKQIAWEFDILWGVKLVRPELAVRIAG